MKNFPYKQEDLINEKDFIVYCTERGYKLNEDFLIFLNENDLLSPINTLNQYSIFQFYLVKEIIDKRYDPYFYRTYFTYNSDGKKFSDETIADFESFDKIYKKFIYPKVIDFFNNYYSIAEDYITFNEEYVKLLYSTAEKDWEKDLIKRVNKLHSTQKIAKFAKDKANSSTSPTQDNIQTINKFIEKHQIEYDKYISIYDSLVSNVWMDQIPEFKIVKDFVSKILLVIEWYYEINDIPYKRKIKWALIGKYDSSCIECGKNFIKKSIDNITCSNKCSLLHKNRIKKEKRKVDKNYWA